PSALVGGQTRKKIHRASKKFGRGLTPRDCRVGSAGGSGGPATEIAEDNPFIAKSAKALKDEFRRDTALMRSRGSIPICRLFKDIPGMDQILVGFALTVDGSNPDLQDRMKEVEALRAANRFTLPTTIGLEKRTNPFLRAGEPALAEAVGMAGKPALEVFAELRERKNRG
ncbi:hydroxyacylglutathione hydrolase C-terminal domain-containing protein, partial [Nostoc sp. NIES-2111]